MPPTLANGKICYIETPATDVARASKFYERVFGWNIRKRGDGATSFDDTTGEVSGTWVLGRPFTAKPDIPFYIMVDSVAASLDAIVAPMRARSCSPLGRTRLRSRQGFATRKET